MTHLPPPSDGDRSTLDEALFAGEFAPSQAADDVPGEAAVGMLQDDEPPVPLLPSPLEWSHEQPPAQGENRRCHDGGTSYQLAGIAPGLFEMRAVPAQHAAPVPEPPRVEEEQEPPAYDFDEPQPPVELPEPVPPEYVFDEEREEEEECDFVVAPVEEPAAEVPPPRLACTLEANRPLEVPAGETTLVGREHLRLSGPAAHLIDVMILSPAECGALLRDGFALTGGDTFTQEDVDQGKISYRHDGGDSTADRFTFATPDGEIQPTVFAFVVRPLRRAPELLAGQGRLAGVFDGLAVREILDGQARCHEPEVEPGLAVVAVAGRGAWFYSLDEGKTWLDFDEVHHGRALLLRPRDVVHFVPKQGWSGTAKLTYRAWDGSRGAAGERLELAARDSVGGATAFSRQPASAALVLPPATPTMPAAPPWRGELIVGELFGDGAAVVRLEGPGEWEYSTDAGASWLEFGRVYHGRARLLGPSDRVRFLRRRGANGKVILSARAWDGRGAASGGTANVAARGSYGDATPYGEFVQTRTWRLSEE